MKLQTYLSRQTFTSWEIRIRIMRWIMWLVKKVKALYFPGRKHYRGAILWNEMVLNWIELNKALRKSGDCQKTIRILKYLGISNLNHFKVYKNQLFYLKALTKLLCILLKFLILKFPLDSCLTLLLPLILSTCTQIYFSLDLLFTLHSWRAIDQPYTQIHTWVSYLFELQICFFL